MQKAIQVPKWQRLLLGWALQALLQQAFQRKQYISSTSYQSKVQAA